MFKNEDYTNREYSEMWTADWWWNIQKLLPPGSTLAPIIIASDKTQLTRFSGDKQAWPVYLTIGNIDKETRRSPSARATILLGYIPVSKLEIFSKAKRSAVGHQLFHDCMRAIFEPLKVAGRNGVWMDCADGFVRKMFPILAVYIADYPEQCLVVGCRENSCPRCLVSPKSRGDTISSPWRNPQETLTALVEEANGQSPSEFRDQNLRPINPFWSNLPHCDIFSCMTPDLLHELHNGVFGDHIVNWTTTAAGGTGGTKAGTEEIDLRFRAMTPHPCMRHFKKGISLTTQWTGGERKNMEKVFLGVIANTTDPGIQRAVRGILDFIYYAHFETHTDESLAKLDAAWASFHANKDVFKILEIREHFDINKLHKLKHYVDSIRSRGTADGFNTENTERLHIDLAKVAYKATNRKAYTRQMTIWLTRQDSLYRFGTYLQWAIPGYVANSSGSSDDEDDCDIDAPESEPPNDDEDAPEAQPEANSVFWRRSMWATYSVAKKPGFLNLPVAAITTEFHAPDFLLHLEHFLDSNSIQSTFPPTENSSFPVYKRFTLTLPRHRQVGSHDVVDTIRAVKGVAQKITRTGVQPTRPGQFDTVLVRERPRAAGADPTDGLRVARIRVIFKLPEEYDVYRHPLAYIDWYKPLQAPVPDIGMHQLSLSSRNHRQNSTIIPINQIVRSCHLIPVFGRHIDRTWSADTVLDNCKYFYLNPYLRHHDFFLFRYLVDLHTTRVAAERRAVQIRLLGRAGR
ncbi:hypothetical protein C8J57DRAFT_1164296 [Mycena rebaudengoi]|nr:hypothetical protein C8J57DRAFT_1164296 [Mycena rebaudengoi]